MIAALIRWSVANRFLVLLAAALVAVAGVWAVRTTPLDAIPDLSDTQVIIRTTFPGQAPQIVEDQVTYPLTTTMLSVPGAKTVRGYSFFGDSFVYVLFEDGTDQYWARSRVLEYLNQVQGRLPAAAKPALGPDATGVGWIYEYALVDRSGTHDLAQLRALQDWFLKYELKAVAERGRGRDRRRHGAAVPGRRRSRAAPRLRPAAVEGDRRDPRREPGNRRLGGRAGRGRVHGPRARLSQVARRFPHDPGPGFRRRRRRCCCRRRARAGRSGDAPRHRRARRRRRGGRRQSSSCARARTRARRSRPSRPSSRR